MLYARTVVERRIWVSAFSYVIASTNIVQQIMVDNIVKEEKRVLSVTRKLTSHFLNKDKVNLKSASARNLVSKQVKKINQTVQVNY